MSLFLLLRLASLLSLNLKTKDTPASRNLPKLLAVSKNKIHVFVVCHERAHQRAVVRDGHPHAVVDKLLHLRRSSRRLPKC